MLVPRDGHEAFDVLDVPEDVARRYLHFAEAELIPEAPEAAVLPPVERAIPRKPAARRPNKK